MSETTRYYISEDDPVVRLMEDHKKALSEISRLKAALRETVRLLCTVSDEEDIFKVLHEARRALEGKDE